MRVISLEERQIDEKSVLLLDRSGRSSGEVTRLELLTVVNDGPSERLSRFAGMHRGVRLVPTAFVENRPPKRSHAFLDELQRIHRRPFCF